jgi:hypothetical protein
MNFVGVSVVEISGNIAVPINSKDEIKLACKEERGNLLQETLFY